MNVSPAWPAIALSGFLFADSVACAIPLRFIKEGLDRVGCSPTLQRVIPAVKFCAAVGLAIGLWKPGFGLFVSVCLVAYFVIAVGFHVRVRDAIANTLPPAVLVICSVLVAATFA